jgi:hypothetical protein
MGAHRSAWLRAHRCLLWRLARGATQLMANRSKSKHIQLGDPVAVAIATIETADDRAHERLVQLACLRRFRSPWTVCVLDENGHVIWCEGQPGWQLFWAQLCVTVYKKKAAFYVEGTDARGRTAFSTVRFEC